ncbi:alkyl sulfatase dimerization domain-containing protein [Vibrio sp. E150_011]
MTVKKLAKTFALSCAIASILGGSIASASAQEQVQRSFPQEFVEHKKYFEPKVYKIGDNKVWSINNTDNWAANTILIEGETGLIVYDTGISRENGKAFLKEIRKISDKPIHTIFYSHHHPDHYNGTDAMVSLEDVKSGKVKIYAWDNFEHGKDHEFGATGPSQATRLSYYIGALLPKEDDHHHGCCGPKYGGQSGYIPPTHTFSTDTDVEIDGVKMRAFLTGGEAASEFGLYLPESKIAVVADEMFPSIPNLYTLRGAKFRDANGYVRAMDAVLNLDVDHLLGTHLVPIEGEKEITKTVTLYRDMVQWIHDQSLRYINKGYTQNELKEQFQALPDWFENKPYSQELYGTLAHIAPQMYTGYVGYFQGDPIEYKPTAPVELAQRHIDLMGGRDKVLAEAQKSFNDNDPQFAAELLTYLIRVDHQDMDARKLKAESFRKLGYAEVNTTWRSWFLTSAKELDGSLDIADVAKATEWLIKIDPRNVAVQDFFKNYRYSVNSEKAENRHITLTYKITDEQNQDVTLELRNGVLIDYNGASTNADLTVELSRNAFNEIAADEVDFETSFKAGKVKISKGDIDTYNEFWGYFDEKVSANRVVIR